MLTGKVRWQQIALFALFALVPAVSVSVLGLRAVRAAEVTAHREVLAMLSAAADRAERTIDQSAFGAQKALADLAASTDPESLERELRRIAPPFADPIVLGSDRTLQRPKPPVETPAKPNAACDRRAKDLSDQADESAKRRARAFILESCPDARAPSGRFLWPIAALDAIRKGEGDPEKLIFWLEERAAHLAPLERRATLLDVQSLSVLPEATRKRIAELLFRSRSRKDELTAVLLGKGAQKALDQAQRASVVVPWKDGGSAGSVRRLPAGMMIGFVVHEASLQDALAARLIDIPEAVRAEVVAGPDSAEKAREGAATSAFAVVAPELVLRMSPRDPGIVPREARRGRWILGGVGVGSTLFACLLSFLLYRRMRDVERSSDLRTDFVSTVSHELRTPIASVRMLAELLEEGRVEKEEQAEVVTALAGEARRLGETVDRLLGFSRMAAGRYQVERKPEKVSEPVLASIVTFEERHPDKSPVERAIDSDIEADIDAGQIRLAIDNLLANAHKYAPEGAPYKVSVRREQSHVVIRVEDRGPGIARRDQKRIFRPFERADDRLSRATEGSGIGLALVAHVAALHGGRAWVESEPGRGATFCLSIETVEEPQ